MPEEMGLRAPGPHEVVAGITAIGWWTPDALVGHGAPFAVPPTVPGHAAAAVVAEVGPTVTGVAVGDRAVVAGIRRRWGASSPRRLSPHDGGSVGPGGQR